MGPTQALSIRDGHDRGWRPSPKGRTTGRNVPATRRSEGCHSRKLQSVMAPDYTPNKSGRLPLNGPNRIGTATEWAIGNRQEATGNREEEPGTLNAEPGTCLPRHRWAGGRQAGNWSLGTWELGIREWALGNGQRQQSAISRQRSATDLWLLVSGLWEQALGSGHRATGIRHRATN